MFHDLDNPSIVFIYSILISGVKLCLYTSRIMQGPLFASNTVPKGVIYYAFTPLSCRYMKGQMGCLWVAAELYRGIQREPVYMYSASSAK